jgi:hypothetical protein
LVLYHKLIFFYINKYIFRACVRLNWGAMGRRKTRQVHSVTASRRQTPSNTESMCSGDNMLCDNKLFLKVHRTMFIEFNLKLKTK